MGIFDFLRKIADKKIKGTKPEKIAFPEIEKWIENKTKEIEAREEEIFALIKEKINVLANELKIKMSVLEDVDIESKKVEYQIKSTVNEGRKKYIECAKSLINNLNNVQKDRLEKVITHINMVFLDFNKSSYTSYERATILIGKEMGDIMGELKVFSKNMTEVFNKNKDIVDSFNVIYLIKSKLKQFEKIEKDIDRISKAIISIEQEIIEKENENKKILEEIEKIKNDADYLEHLEKLEKIKSLREDLKKNFLSLRQLIDFKALGNFYHIFEDKIEMIKSFREEFETNFQKDDGKSISNLLNNAKLNTKDISDKINQINKKREEIAKNETEAENEKNKDKSQELCSKTSDIIIRIGNLTNEKAREEKRCEKLKASKKGILNEINEEFGKIGIELC